MHEPVKVSQRGCLNVLTPISVLQSEYICQLASSHIFDLFLAIAAQSDTSEYAPWNMLTLDIFHLLFRCVGVVELMKPADKVRLSYLTPPSCDKPFRGT